FYDVAAGLPQVQGASVAWGDYDGDGLPDLALIGDNTNGTPLTRVYHNEGNGAFRDIRVNLQNIPNIENGSVNWVQAGYNPADSNPDKNLDLLITGDVFTGPDQPLPFVPTTAGRYVPFTGLYRNNGNGTFSLMNSSLPAVESGSTAWADYDGDGRLDL